MKKILALALVSAQLIYGQEPVTLPAEKTRIHWDCHQVLVKPNISAMASLALWQVAPKIARVLVGLCSDTLDYVFDERTGPTFTLLGEIYAKLKMSSVTVEDFEPVLNAYDPSIYPLAITMAAQHVPITGMAELVQELHELGYEQGQATNMSPTEYELIAEKHPEIFGYFKPGLTVDVSEENPVRKPSPEYFMRLVARFGAEHEHNVFVDDKRKNVETAERAGLIALQFKNAEQLREVLRSKGVPVAASAPREIS